MPLPRGRFEINVRRKERRKKTKEPHDKRANGVWFNKRLISQTNKLNKVTKRLTKCISPYFDEADTILLLEEGSSLRFKTTKMTADNHLVARFLFLESVRIINI